jgi:tRNA G18 (ribose-2'-O)-methylase SpoU
MVGVRLQMTASHVIEIDDLEHPLVEPYRDIRGRNWTWRSGIFIAEGPLLVERLLNSPYQIQSILVERKCVDRFEQNVPSNVPLIVVEHDFVEQLVGFNFHRGVLACGVRRNIDELPSTLSVTDRRETWLGLFGVQDPENLGGMLRTAAGLGIRRIVLGPGTCDPLSRRALRVSMGNALQLEMYRASNARQSLLTLKALGVECVATALGDGSQPVESAKRSGPLILLMGNERDGLTSEVLDLADRCVRVDMELGTDSLNVCVAAGITMHYFCRIAR